MANGRIPTWYLPDKKGTTELGSIANALLPYMDYAGQVSTSANLSAGDPIFSSYQPYNLPKMPLTVPEQKKQYLSREKAERTLSAINRMMSISGITTEGPGIKYLKDTVNTLRSLGGPGGAMSRSNMLKFQESMVALKNSQAAQDAEGYATLAGYATNYGDAMPTRTVSGRTVFGNANKKLYG